MILGEDVNYKLSKWIGNIDTTVTKTRQFNYGVYDNITLFVEEKISDRINPIWLSLNNQYERNL
jgi:hypothetical protein